MNLSKIVAVTDQLARLMSEDDAPDIQAKHPGILEIPGGRAFSDMGAEHFIALAEKHGRPEITKALVNLERWGENKDKKTAGHAKKVLAALKKHFDGK